jgi:hypothetical protein
MQQEKELGLVKKLAISFSHQSSEEGSLPS